MLLKPGELIGVIVATPISADANKAVDAGLIEL